MQVIASASPWRKKGAKKLRVEDVYPELKDQAGARPALPTTTQLRDKVVQALAAAGVEVKTAGGGKA